MSIYTEFISRIADQPLHRRHHRKDDGRNMWLYGFEKHDQALMHEAGFDVPIGGEIRFHPLRGDWAVYAAHRQGRTFKPSLANDPLAPTQPGGDATEIPFQEFEITVFENRFPGFHMDVNDPETAVPGLDVAPSSGTCEVVVYTSEQVGSLATLSAERRELLVEVWTDRVRALRSAERPYVQPFENRGDAAGVTLAHPHGQIYAFPVVPPVQQAAAKAFASGYSLEDALKDWGEGYVVARAGGMVLVAPPFARFPYETWIVPETRRAGLWDLTPDEVRGLALLMGEVNARYDAHFEANTPLMMSVQSAPWGCDALWHFTVQFYPLMRAPGRLKYLASVEQSTGVFTVDVMPETTAQLLRSKAFSLP